MSVVVFNANCSDCGELMLDTNLAAMQIFIEGRAVGFVSVCADCYDASDCDFEQNMTLHELRTGTSPWLGWWKPRWKGDYCDVTDFLVFDAEDVEPHRPAGD